MKFKGYDKLTILVELSLVHGCQYSQQNDAQALSVLLNRYFFRQRFFQDKKVILSHEETKLTQKLIFIFLIILYGLCFQNMFSLHFRKIQMNCSVLKFSAPINEWSGKRKYYFLKEVQFMDIDCGSARFLKDIAQIFDIFRQPLRKDGYTQQQCIQIIEEIIKPVYGLTKSWRDGGMCQNCLLCYSQETFEEHLSIQKRLIDGVISENKKPKYIKKHLLTYAESIQSFHNYYNCTVHHLEVVEQPQQSQQSQQSQ